MSLLLSCQSLSKSFGSRHLFDQLSLSIFEGDRIGLIGPNGAGKSTLVKILAGLEKADSGILSAKRELRIGHVPQISTFTDLPPLEILLERLRQEDSLTDYERVNRAETWLSKMGFKGSEPSAAALSGGWKKRLSIASELVLTPDLLFLDEPTNHLDLDSVLWLESFLCKELSTMLIISHDRSFLQAMANRIIEINPLYPEGLLSIDGSFDHFLEKKNLFIEGQLEQERSMAAKARRETAWLRVSPKARTTKATARIEKAEEILNEHQALRWRNSEKRAKIAFDASERETVKLLTAKNLRMDLGGRTLFQHLDLTLSPGTRLGLMGPNGSGKTTLLKLLAGESLPTQGTLKPANDLKVVYFDQHRSKLPLDLTLREVLSPTGEYVTFRARPVHIHGWCKRFLFSPDDLGLTIKELSGGERARIAIAHLMLQPADILLLDEPTNDLDIPTLETLEESLSDFPGAVVLITHDRRMLENICNLFLALGDPSKSAFYAEFAQWEALHLDDRARQTVKESEKKLPMEAKKASSKREIERIEKEIALQEGLLKKLQTELEKKSSGPGLHELCRQTAELEAKIEVLYAKWGNLSQ